ncbi:chloride channel protein [soil metagenome]
MDILRKFLLWRARHLSLSNFSIILGVVVGVAAGLAAVILKTSTHFIQKALTTEYDFGPFNYLYLAFPLIGMLLTTLFVIYLNRNKLGHGLTNILYNISKKGANIERDKTYSHVVTSALTVGFGGSVGLEAPIVTTGAAIGSNLGRLFHLNYPKRTLLIGCGAAAAIAGVFNSPITGVVFALEVLLLELTIPSFIPLLLAAVTGTIVSRLLLGEEILFNFKLANAFAIRDVPLYMLLGVVSGLVSVYFSRIIGHIEFPLLKINNRYKRVLIGGSLLGMMIFLLPPLYGEGYDTLKAVFTGHPEHVLDGSMFQGFRDNAWAVWAFIVALVFAKVVASSLTIGGGGNGGVFAPSLFTGGLLGFGFARLVNLTGFSHTVSESNFGLVGMAGLISGVMHAPLTGIFLVVEITTTYELILPLMIVSGIAFATVKYFEPHSIYTKQLALKGHLTSGNKDKQLLTIMQIQKVIETDLQTIKPTDTLGHLADIIAHSHRNIFPVVNEDRVLIGIITLDDVREIMFQRDRYDTVLVKDLSHPAPAMIQMGDDMETVMRHFDSTGAWNLPVVKDGKYIGFLSKSKIFSSYRGLLVRQAKEE